MRLSDYAVGRDNNFNLIRLLAALSVMFSHSIAVLGLPGIARSSSTASGFRPAKWRSTCSSSPAASW